MLVGAKAYLSHTRVLSLKSDLSLTKSKLCLDMIKKNFPTKQHVTSQPLPLKKDPIRDFVIPVKLSTVTSCAPSWC